MLGTPRRDAQVPRPRSVRRSETSIASGRSRSSRRCTRQGSTARYPPVPGSRGAAMVIRRMPEGSSWSADRVPGTTSTTSWARPA
jgi:hypothetical protein